MERLEALVGKDRNQAFPSGLAGGLIKAAGKGPLELVAAREGKGKGNLCYRTRGKAGVN